MESMRRNFDGHLSRTRRRGEVFGRIAVASRGEMKLLSEHIVNDMSVNVG